MIYRSGTQYTFVASTALTVAHRMRATNVFYSFDSNVDMIILIEDERVKEMEKIQRTNEMK